MRHVICGALVILAFECVAQAPQQAFNDGLSFGAGAAPNVGSNISATTGATTVPLYSSTQPQTNFFQGGQGVLTPLGTQQVSDCQTLPPDPDARARQQCEATKFLANKPTGGSFTIAPNDPVLATARPITADPTSVLGTMSGTYSACTPQTVSLPERHQLLVCTENRNPEAMGCAKILNVTITQEPSCTPGTWFAVGQADRNFADHMYAQAYCEPDRTDGLQRFAFYATGSQGACVGWQTRDLPTDISSTMVGLADLAPHWEGFCWGSFKVALAPGSGCTGTSCNYAFLFGFPTYACPQGLVPGDQVLTGEFPVGTAETCYATTPDFGCPSDQISAVVSGMPVCAQLAAPAAAVGVGGWTLPLAFQKPRVLYLEHDTWDNQCAAMEARLP